MRIGRNAESVWEWLFLAGLATAACAEQQVARETSRPTAKPGAVAEPARAAPPACQPPRDRPAASEAEVRERRESPSHRVVRRGGARATAPRSAEARKRPDTADPAAGNGWFCVEARGDSPRQRTSSCHRTAAECEQRRASLGAAAPAGDCAWSSVASCYLWQGPAKSGRSCFYRPSQCQRDKMIRDEAEQQPGSLWTSACYSAP